MGTEILAIASIGASLLGAGVSAYGALKTGQATQDASNYRAAVANNMAEYTKLQGEQEAQNQNMKTSAIIGTQHAEQGASGIDADSGTNLKVRQSAEQLGHLDALTIMNNAANKAAGLKDESKLDIMTGQNAKTASYLQAETSVLGGVSSVSDKWLNYSTKGVPGFSSKNTSGILGGYG